MVTPPPPEEDPVVGFLMKRCGSELAADPAGPCPGDEVFMGFAGGWLLPTDREALEVHLGRCEHCRAIVDHLPGGAKSRSGRWALRIPLPAWPGAQAQTGRRWLEVRPFAAAAALLLAVAAGIGIRSLFRSAQGLGGAGGTDGRLVAAARDLGRARPDLFAEFAPLSREERLATQPELRSGNLALLYPAGKVFEARPTFRWESEPATGEEEIVLRTASGRTLWKGSARAPRLPYPADAPALEPGVRYVWEVGGSDRRRLFAAASAAEREAFESAKREIDGKAPADLRSLLTAHFALRRELYGAAEQSAWASILGLDEGPRLGEARPEEAEEAEGHLARARERGDGRAEATALAELGFARLRLGDPAKALENLRQHAALAGQLGIPPRVRVRDDPVGWETLDFLLRRLGASGVGGWFPKGTGGSQGR